MTNFPNQANELGTQVGHDFAGSIAIHDDVYARKVLVAMWGGTRNELGIHMALDGKTAEDLAEELEMDDTSSGYDEILEAWGDGVAEGFWDELEQRCLRTLLT